MGEFTPGGEKRNEGAYTRISSTLIKKLISTGDTDIRVFTKYENDKSTLYTNDLKKLENRSLPALYMDAEGKAIIYDAISKSYSNDLTKVLDDPDTDQKTKAKIAAKLAVDCVGVSLDELGNAANKQTVRHLKGFMDQLLTGFAGNGLSSLMNEIKNLKYTVSRQALETAVLTQNLYDTLGNDNDELNSIGATAAIFHDVGMVKIDEKTIYKSGPLTDEERAEINKHPMYSYEILNGINFRELGFSEDAEKSIKEAALQHHERLDGKGYPQGLGEGSINSVAEILAIVDIYAAKTSPLRIYGEMMTSEKTIEYMEELSKKSDTKKAQLNPVFVEKFKKSLERLGIITI